MLILRLSEAFLAKYNADTQHEKKEGKTMPDKELKPYKEVAKDLSPEDTSPILEMACACLKNRGGHPYTYANNQAGLETFKKSSELYFLNLKEANSNLDEKHQIIPDIEGYALHLGIDRSTLLRYRNRSEQWKAMIDYYKNVIAFCKKQLALRGKIPAVLAVFDLSNNHQYVNTSEFKLTTEEITKAADDKNMSLEERIAQSGLVWNEERQEWEYE